VQSTEARRKSYLCEENKKLPLKTELIKCRRAKTVLVEMLCSGFEIKFTYLVRSAHSLRMIVG
jgi:hypothetical protein